MADCEKEESANLQMEFEWVLHEEVHAVLNQLHTILMECARRFPVPLCGNDGPHKQDKFVLSAAPEQLKCMLTLTGDSISCADISFKIQRQQNFVYRTSIQTENPWKLQQIQDAGNHLQQAILHVENVDKDYMFKSSEEVLYVLGSILGSLQRGRSSLIIPRKRTIDDLMRSRNMEVVASHLALPSIPSMVRYNGHILASVSLSRQKSLSPVLPEDLAISFYIQSHKLIFAVYQLTNVHGQMKFDSHQAECSVPWLNEVLVLFTVALQLCQQLKDKICVFSQYKDFTVGSRVPSPLPW